MRWPAGLLTPAEACTYVACKSGLPLTGSWPVSSLQRQLAHMVPANAGCLHSKVEFCHRQLTPHRTTPSTRIGFPCFVRRVSKRFQVEVPHRVILQIQDHPRVLAVEHHLREDRSDPRDLICVRCLFCNVFLLMYVLVCFFLLLVGPGDLEFAISTGITGNEVEKVGTSTGKPIVHRRKPCRGHHHLQVWMCGECKLRAVASMAAVGIHLRIEPVELVPGQQIHPGRSRRN